MINPDNFKVRVRKHNFYDIIVYTGYVIIHDGTHTTYHYCNISRLIKEDARLDAERYKKEMIELGTY